MSEFIQFAVLGIGTGAIYALLGQGVVLIYRGSGVVNFAQGTFALVGGYLFAELRNAGVPLAACIVLPVLAGGLLGVLMQVLIMRRLRDAAPIIRIIATLGVLITIEAAGALRYADNLTSVKQYLPNSTVRFLGTSVQVDRLTLIGIAVLVTVALALFSRRSLVGLATTGAAENETAAAALGWSPNRLAILNWGMGGALAGLAGVLIAPVSGLLVGSMTLLIVPALAAALLGRFDSFALTLLGAFAIGAAQALCLNYVDVQGAADAVPFLVIIAVLVVTGQSLPLRSFVGARLPSIGSGAIRGRTVMAWTLVAGLLLLFVMPVTVVDAVTVSLAVAVVLLSIVVVTGYAGQISLGQYALGGLGAFVAGKAVAAWGWPLWAALICGVVAAIPIGLVFALPALRTRGVNLAVVTLGLGLTVDRVLFQNVNYTGGIQGTDVGAAKLFGLPIDAISYPGRYAAFVLVAFALAACGVANLRRSAAGRRMIAIRSNERAAASLGVSVTRTKLYAFAVSSAIAALGGILIGFRSSSVVYTNFDAMQSIHASAFAVIGGLGYVIGPVLGSTLEGGGIGSLFNEIVPGIDRWMALIGGVSVIGLLLINPDGLVSGHLAQGRWIGLRLRALVPGPLRERQAARRAARAGRAGERAGSAVAEAGADAQPQRVVPRRLEVSDLTVRFGGVVAVDALSLSVGPGEVVGLIGPNGAGKTSFIDATSGFVRPAEGRVVMDGVDVVGRSAHARVKAGLARSWQSLELFEDVTVLENLQVASDDSGWREEVLAPLRPGRPVLNPAAAAAVAEFRLEDDLLKRPADIPFGRRRLVGIARAVALNPSVLLLDEPAAGLSDAESAELASLMRRLADRWGMGILLVEHNVDLVMGVCDRVVVLDFGRKIAEGTPAQTRNDPAVVAAYLGGGSNPEPVEAR